MTRHLGNIDTNERVAFGASRGVTPMLREALEELAIRGATARGKKTLFHVVANPEPSELMTSELWVSYWRTLELEFQLENQPFGEVIHDKNGKLDGLLRSHRHRVYSLVRDDGMLVPVANNYRRNELVSRVFEATAGHVVRPGRHHRWVLGSLRHQHGRVPSALVSAQDRTQATTFSISQAEFQQAEQKLEGKDPRPFRKIIYALFTEAGGNWRRFAAALDDRKITIAAGRSAILVIEERSEFQISLVRLLREEAKKNGTPLKITSAEIARAFSGAQPLDTELQHVRHRNAGREDKTDVEISAATPDKKSARIDASTELSACG